ncbi:hypothetical protein, partial [Guyparkeria sp.]|uniref:hypothetical protein n=1 Tax=Guyparkeria sp. TaxID=2035736 RepID=UPI0039709F45
PMKNLLGTAMGVLGLVLATSGVMAQAAKCPVSGKPADPGVTLNVNGKAVGFCCEKGVRALYCDGLLFARP